MNRLIIIGNGFDLAHNLPTKYCDFINDYWGNILGSNHSDEMISFSRDNYLFNKPISLTSILNHLNDSNEFPRASIRRENLHYVEGNNKTAIIYKNEFFENLCRKFSETNWVDIEMEYYSDLKKIINNYHDDSEETIYREVSRLNREFDELKIRFNQYLISKVIDQVKNKKIKKLGEILKPVKIYSENELAEFLNEFPYKTVLEIQKEIYTTRNKLDNALEQSIYKLNETLILNFNYTQTINNYQGELDEHEVIYIHGQANNNVNPINFGFGNEMDSQYELIENKNKNEYLRFIKSFAYSNNSGYRKFLNFIEKDKFQVHILGHSCGLSDRTLLNTVFEHENCRSIKVFFHKYKTADPNGVTDNYTDIVQNISRQFNKKKTMREKIVSYDSSECLPQIDDN